MLALLHIKSEGNVVRFYFIGSKRVKGAAEAMLMPSCC